MKRKNSTRGSFLLILLHFYCFAMKSVVVGEEAQVFLMEQLRAISALMRTEFRAVVLKRCRGQGTRVEHIPLTAEEEKKAKEAESSALDCAGRSVLSTPVQDRLLERSSRALHTSYCGFGYGFADHWPDRVAFGAFLADCCAKDAEKVAAAEAKSEHKWTLAKVIRRIRSLVFTMEQAVLLNKPHSHHRCFRAEAQL